MKLARPGVEIFGFFRKKRPHRHSLPGGVFGIPPIKDDSLHWVPLDPQVPLVPFIERLRVFRFEEYPAYAGYTFHHSPRCVGMPLTILANYVFHQPEPAILLGREDRL